MDGYEFEYQCAKILKRKHFSKIKVTQSSGDQGIDIIAFKHRKKYGIQCKYYTHPVGNKAVVMTNITFTKSATQLAQKLDVELWPNCPVTPFYSLPFKIMSSLNAVLFLYAVLAFLSLKPEFDFIHLPFVPDTLTLVIILTASIFGIFGWSFFLCNLIAAGAYLYLAFHTLILPTYAETGSCTNIHMLSLLPAGVYLLHAGWIKIRK